MLVECFPDLVCNGGFGFWVESILADMAMSKAEEGTMDTSLLMGKDLFGDFIYEILFHAT